MATTAVNVYKKALVANFRFLKASRDVREAYLRAIPVADAGFLVPIGESRLDDADLLAKLTRWRNEHVHVYPTQFEATVDSTRAWLKERLLATDDRILFLVEDRHGRAVGHIGFNGCLNDERLFEIDNVVRGDAAGAKGLFSLALQALIEWARTTSNVEGFFLRVMDDNPGPSRSTRATASPRSGAFRSSASGGARRCPIARRATARPRTSISFAWLIDARTKPAAR